MSDEAEIKEKAREYLKSRGTLVAPAVIHERVAAAFTALEAFLDTVPVARAACPGPPGEWTVQEIVDHLVETHRPGLDELLCLLAGQPPPGEAIPASLQSKAPLLRPWSWLRDELRHIHGGILDALGKVPADFVTEARAPLVMVVNVPDASGRVRPLHWVEELDWKAYAITWRLHTIDHLHQAKKVLAAHAPA
jgi:hypothetical protein